MSQASAPRLGMPGPDFGGVLAAGGGGFNKGFQGYQDRERKMAQNDFQMKLLKQKYGAGKAASAAAARKQAQVRDLENRFPNLKGMFGDPGPAPAQLRPLGPGETDQGGAMPWLNNGPQAAPMPAPQASNQAVPLPQAGMPAPAPQQNAALGDGTETMGISIPPGLMGGEGGDQVGGGMFAGMPQSDIEMLAGLGGKAGEMAKIYLAQQKAGNAATAKVGAAKLKAEADLKWKRNDPTKMWKLVKNPDTGLDEERMTAKGKMNYHKQWRDRIQPSLTKLQTVDKQMRTARAALKLGTGTGDIAAINAIQRMIDPGVVRGEDVKLQATAQSLGEEIALYIKKKQTGQLLGPKLRAKMLDVAEQITQSTASNAEITLGGYKDIVDQNQDLSWRKIMPRKFDRYFDAGLGQQGWSKASDEIIAAKDAGGLGNIDVDKLTRREKNLLGKKMKALGL